MSENGSLPEGTVVLQIEQPDLTEGQDVSLALDLARLGASQTLIQTVGGEEALRAANWLAKNGEHP